MRTRKVPSISGAWRKVPGESHRRESSQIMTIKNFTDGCGRTLLETVLRCPLSISKKKLRGFASSLQLGAPGKVLEKGESPPNEDSMDFFHFGRVLAIFGTCLILMVLQSCWKKHHRFFIRCLGDPLSIDVNCTFLFWGLVLRKRQ